MTNQMAEIEEAAKKMKSSSKVKIDAICLNPHISYNTREIEDMDIADEDILVIETPKTKDVYIL